MPAIYNGQSILAGGVVLFKELGNFSTFGERKGMKGWNIQSFVPRAPFGLHTGLLPARVWLTVPCGSGEHDVRWWEQQGTQQQWRQVSHYPHLSKDLGTISLPWGSLTNIFPYRIARNTGTNQGSVPKNSKHRCWCSEIGLCQRLCLEAHRNARLQKVCLKWPSPPITMRWAPTWPRIQPPSLAN